MSMKKMLIAFAVIAALLAAETAYVALGSQASGKDIRYFVSPAGNVANTNVNAKSSGSFEIHYSTPENKSFSGTYETIKQSGVFDDMVYQLNRNFVLPTNVWIIFAQCGSSTAFYDPDQKKIEVCYEFFNNVENMYSAMDVTQNVTAAALNNTEFVLYNEIGHALIDTLNIPVTGKEEDAADQLATLLVLENGQNDDTPVFLTAYSLAFQSANKNPNDLQLWDEHSLEGQRFFNIICWLYGQNPAKYQLFASQLIPDERLQKCEGEYAKMFRSWVQLLGPYFKNG